MKSSKTKKIFSVLTALLIIFAVTVPISGMDAHVNAVATDKLIPGGMAFGVKFFTEGAILLGTTGVETAAGLVSPAKDAGLQAGDIIIRAGGTEFQSANQLISIISGCGGKAITIDYVRDDKEYSQTLTPARDLESGEYRIGALIKDSTAGIGTVTYIDPETMDFGGLGHGIYDADTGLLMPLGRGAIVDISITDVAKSERNLPGELKGEFGIISRGELWDNTHEGVFGRFDSLPQNSSEALPVAERSEIKEGEAHILTTVSGNQISEFQIEIEEIYVNSGSTKNFLVHVTDQSLIDTCGGIVQGMSGSPIIQDGKLIGAVTHVLVNDPSRGYGIFIENMLESAYDVDIQQEYSSLAA